MFNRISLYIGLRYIRAKRRNSFISFVSLFSLIGMALGVFALIVVLSVMNGFDRELKQRILRVVSHGAITSQQPLVDWPVLVERLQAMPQVLGAAPYVQGYGMADVHGSVHSVQIHGIEPSLEPDVSEVHAHMLAGQLDALQAGEYRVILGALLARYLDVGVGDKVNLTLPLVAVTPAGIFPRARRFTVVGIFEVGAQLDQELALVHWQDAQRLFRRGDAVDGVRLRFDDIYRAPADLRQIEAELGEQYSGRDWSETQGSLFQAVQMEKTVVGVMLSIIITVAAFNIVTTLIMMIAEKRSDIAVLRTMGLPARGVVGLFVVQGVALGVSGIIAGAALGLVVATHLGAMVAWAEQLLGAQIFDPTVYFVTALPSEVQAGDIVRVCLGAFVISLLATCYPAYRASQIQPAEALRYNI